jgi:hypothetical protein
VQERLPFPGPSRTDLRRLDVDEPAVAGGDIDQMEFRAVRIREHRSDDEGPAVR